MHPFMTAMTATPADRAAKVLAAIESSERPEVWISQVTHLDLTYSFEKLDERLAKGEKLPLAGLTFAVKDNIDVGGIATTAACPGFSYIAQRSAPAVDALLDSGAIYVGKTNLDQFATGLVGTRSPYGSVRNAIDSNLISGGSSSGSAVAVALSLVDFALGTDTAGSGRVPAALNGIIGIKPTVGMISTTGVVPACWSFDCVTVFARDVTLARRLIATMSKTDPQDPLRRQAPPTAPLGLPTNPVVAFVDDIDLPDLSPERLTSYHQAIAVLRENGCSTVPIDLEPFLRAGRLLYDGAFVAERFAAVGDWVKENYDRADPIVGSIIVSGGGLKAEDFAADLNQLSIAKRETATALSSIGASSLILPTVGFHPTFDEVTADPIGVNSRLGRYSTFVNLLDLCAVSVPSASLDGLPTGVTLIGPAWSDVVQADLAQILEGHSRTAIDSLSIEFPALAMIEIAVVGAHLRGQPLNYQLTERGGRLLYQSATAPTYSMFALATTPPKPGLVRVEDPEVGHSIEVEIWGLSPNDFAGFVASIVTPMTIGSVALLDGSHVTGFLCEPAALSGARDISESGGWRAYLAQTTWSATASTQTDSSLESFDFDIGVQ